MIFENRRQIWWFLLANIVAISANGQSYADRGNFHTGIGLLDEDEDDQLHTEYYDWNHAPDAGEIWRWNVEDYPHPQLSPRYCKRPSSSNVCDPDEVLTISQANNLDDLIRKLYNETPCVCDGCGSNDGGIEVGIALLKNTFQPYLEHRYKVIRSFSKNLRSKWRLGECEDDILIVVATKDRQSYTDVGNAASRYISKDEAYSIFLKNKVYFSKGEYYEGLREMLKAYQEVTKAFVRPTDESEVNVALLSGIVVIIVIVIGVILLIAAYLYRRKKDRSGTNSKRGEKSSSWHWRRKDIKLPKRLFSPFMSTPDTYQPCKTDEKKQDAGQDVTSGHPEDDEILNLALAEPEPKPIDVDKETADNDRPPSSTPSFHGDDVRDNEPNNTNVIPSVTEGNRNEPSEIQFPTNSERKILQTFAPKAPAGLLQTDF